MIMNQNLLKNKRTSESDVKIALFYCVKLFAEDCMIGFILCKTCVKIMLDNI